MKKYLRCIALGLIVGTAVLFQAVPESSVGAQGSLPTITGIVDNRSQYPGSQIPTYEKLEITFQVTTVATNLQWPYDPAPPSGVTPNVGVTVNGLFSPDNWQTVYTQPAFHYQDYNFQQNINNSGQDWIYPTGIPVWKVRFAPDTPGNWQYKLSATDAGGSLTTQHQPFTVNSSSNKGFIRVSQKDSRYFEYRDGTYFPALGYNMNWDHINWNNPVTDNQSNFQKMGQNGIQLVRMWLSQWAIFGAEWNPWRWIGANPDWHYLVNTTSYNNAGVSLILNVDNNACMSEGHWLSPPIGVKPNTNYRVQVRVMTSNTSGPRIAGNLFGFVVKIPASTDSWLLGSGKNCYDPGVGIAISSYLSANNNWTLVSGSFNSGNNYFLPAFYLALENVNSGSLAYVDHVWLQEDLGNGQFGPNLIVKPGMDHHQYFDQRMSFAFDKVVELAHQNGVYLRPVVLEKNDWILNRIDYNGNLVPDSQASNNNFYGNWRQVTMVRWLQQAWWRYLQARWGYSPNIQSWELLNEGDPFNGLHYTLADEFGNYMHQFRPNDHLVSTSNWHSFPRTDFWSNSSFPNVDFADVHAYVSETNNLSVRVDNSNISVDSSNNISDTAGVTQKLSMLLGAKRQYGARKPIIRGEVGFYDPLRGTDFATHLFDNDLAGSLPLGQGVWLHNFVWGGINPGGLIESYWSENVHVYGTGFDHRTEYGNFYRFIKDIPLNNGNYQDAAASASNNSLRVWGQKDLINGRAHVWIQNINHSWYNVINRINIVPISDSVTISGFRPNTPCTTEWWDTYTGTTNSFQSSSSNTQGTLSIPVNNLTTDIAVKISCSSSTSRVFLPIIVK